MPPEHVKRSTIFISVDGTTRVYRSPEEVPVPLRKKLLDSVTGWNAATILIADQRGREEIAKAMRGQPAAVKFRFLASPGTGEGDEPGAARRWLLRHWRWAGALLFPATALLIWYLFTYR